jgi:hypothetical protein
MMLSVGTRYSFKSPRTIYEGSPEGVSSIAEKIMPGYIYEVQYTVDPAIKREDVGKAYDLLMKIEEKIPGIGLNYMGISDDGKTVIFQIFDPPIAPELVAAVITLLKLALILAIAYVVVTGVKAIVELVAGKIPTPPSWAGDIFWIGVAVVLIGGGAYLIRRAIAK